MEKIILLDIKNNQYNASFLPQKYNQYKYNKFIKFGLKHMSIVNRLIYLNSYLEKHYKNWEYLISKPNNNLFTLSGILEHKNWENKLINNYFEQEEIVMHLRKAIDDCIFLLSIVTGCLKKDKKNNIERPYESVGEVVNQIDRFKILKKHKDYLKKVKDISNGFKHCGANTMTLKLGIEKPCIFVYENQDNHNYYNEIGIYIDDLVKGFNEFYTTFDAEIKKE